jgi:ribosomal protein L7/L12
MESEPGECVEVTGGERLPAAARELTEAERATLPERVVAGPLGAQFFSMHGRIYFSVENLEPSTVAEAFDTWPANVGLHVGSCVKRTGIAPWVAWNGLERVVHLSFAEGGLSFDGLQQLLVSGKVAHLLSLDLGGCNIGPKGLRLLRSSYHMAHLEELHLTANPKEGRSKHDVKALQNLLKPTKRAPVGETLSGLKLLGLMFWELDGAKSLLEGSAVIKGLDALFVHEEARGLPEWLQDKCVRVRAKASPEAPKPARAVPPAAVEPSSYTVTLERIGPSRVMAIRALAMTLHTTLGEARNLLETLPLQVAAGCDEARRDELERAFADAGATIRVDRV